MSVVKFLNKDRHKGLGGSDSGVLMGTEYLPIHNLWCLKTQRKKEDNLSDVLPVQMGVHTESFNMRWFAKQTGILTEPYPEEYVQDGFRYAHFDGWCPKEKAIIECKHTNAFTNKQKVKVRYYAQVQHYLMMSNLKTCYLSIFFGNMKWDYIKISLNEAYLDELVRRQDAFWQLVVDDQEPTADNTAWRLYE